MYQVREGKLTVREIAGGGPIDHAAAAVQANVDAAKDVGDSAMRAMGGTAKPATAQP